MIQLSDLTIRTELKPGDLGYITYRHGALYSNECQYGIEFESYVAQGLHEFLSQYDPNIDRAWLAEHEGRIAGPVEFYGKHCNSVGRGWPICRCSGVGCARAATASVGPMVFRRGDDGARLGGTLRSADSAFKCPSSASIQFLEHGLAACPVAAL